MASYRRPESKSARGRDGGLLVRPCRLQVELQSRVRVALFLVAHRCIEQADRSKIALRESGGERLVVLERGVPGLVRERGFRPDEQPPLSAVLARVAVDERPEVVEEVLLQGRLLRRVGFRPPRVVLCLRGLGHEGRVGKTLLGHFAVDDVPHEKRRRRDENHQQGDAEPADRARQEIVDPAPDRLLGSLLTLPTRELLTCLHSPYTPLSFMMPSSFTSFDR